VSGVWSSLWSLQAPWVLKHFFWKVCNNALPTKDNLYRKKILQDPLCPICAHQVETVWHVLWACPASVDVWQECHRKILKLSLVESDGLGWVQQLMAKLDTNVLLEALSVARCIWLRRNGAVFRQGFSDPKQIVTLGREAVCNFAEANNKAIMGEPDPLVIEPKWLKPSPGWVKLNWDAAISSSLKIMGVGVVSRNDEGAVLAGLSAPVPYVVDPTTAEVMVAWRAVKLGIEMCYQQIILEGDSMLTVCALNQATPCMSGYGPMIEDIQVTLLSFSSFIVRHVGRKANFAAHTSAKNALSLVSALMRVEECRPSIQHILISENL
jgi:hypothetical protein